MPQPMTEPPAVVSAASSSSLPAKSSSKKGMFGKIGKSLGKAFSGSPKNADKSPKISSTPSQQVLTPDPPVVPSPLSEFWKQFLSFGADQYPCHLQQQDVIYNPVKSLQFSYSTNQINAKFLVNNFSFAGVRYPTNPPTVKTTPAVAEMSPSRRALEQATFLCQRLRQHFLSSLYFGHVFSSLKGRNSLLFQGEGGYCGGEGGGENAQVGGEGGEGRGKRAREGGEGKREGGGGARGEFLRGVQRHWQRAFPNWRRGLCQVRVLRRQRPRAASAKEQVFRPVWQALRPQVEQAPRWTSWQM